MRLVRENLERFAAATGTIREMDRKTIEDYGIPGVILMEHAGSAACEVALEMLGESGRVLVVAGAGNNAGDGFVVARLLANRGFAVEIVTAVPVDRYKGDTQVNFGAAVRMDIQVRQWDRSEAQALARADLVVDALLGTGLKGGLKEPYVEIIAVVNAAAKPVLSIDIPSGLDGDTGEVRTTAVRATRTVTFALPKAGFYRRHGREHTGEVVLADIEMPRRVYPAELRPEPL